MESMPFDRTSEKLRALPVQLVEVPDGVILRRGSVEIKIGGERAVEVTQIVLAAAAEKDVTLEEICERFAAPDRPAVQHLVEQLIARRLLVPSEAANPTGEGGESSLDIFYWQFGESAARVTERLNSRQTVIMGVNHISRQLAASLTASGVDNFRVVDFPLLRNLRLFDETGRLRAGQWPTCSQPPMDYQEWMEGTELQSLGCLVATSDFGSHQAMREWNKFCVEYQRHFLPVVLQTPIGYVGPLVVPGETACFECLRVRQNSHLQDPDGTRATEGVAFEGQAVTSFHPSMASVLGDIAAIELAKFYSGVLPLWNVGRLIEVNLLSPRLTARKVLKIPRCIVCSPLNTHSSIMAKKVPFSTANRINP
jgi:molybdopterin-synthase adenylyltransferase